MTRDRLPGRAAGWLVALVGVGLALAVQIAAPVGVPLYDGVSVVEPYRFLHPTGSQPGGPTDFSAEPQVVGGVSPAIVAATSESPPQAQLIAQRDAFTLPPGATTLRVTITPIDPAAAPASGAVAGNAYRFSITDQAGAPVQPKPCDACLSLVLRAPEGVNDGVIQRFSAGAWTPVDSLHAGVVAMYQSNPTALGDYAVVSGSPVSGDGGGTDLTFVILGGGIALVVAAFVVLLFLRNRPPPTYPARPRGAGGAAGTSRIPSKRRGPRRPPSGGAEQ